MRSLAAVCAWLSVTMAANVGAHLHEPLLSHAGLDALFGLSLAVLAAWCWEARR